MIYNTLTATMKLIAFDWDQTLWNSWDLHLMAAQYAARVVGLPEPSEELMASTFSVPFARYLEMVFPSDTQEATRHYMEYYHSRVGEFGTLFEGVPRTLKALRDGGTKVALLSDKQHVYGNVELDSAGISDLFDYVLFLNEGHAYKPDPEGLLQVVKSLSVKKEDVVYVGDSHVDVQCARRTGVSSAAALWGSVNVDAVLKEKPDFVLNDVSEVLTALPRVVDG